jgi:secreted trypsin-like serine protease
MTKLSIFFSYLLLYSFQSFAIIGGELVFENDLSSLSTVGLSNGCTGTLIRTDVVMTAAHCLARSQNIEIIFGLSFQAGKRVSVKSIRIHPGYNSTAGGGTTPDSPATRPIHDIAIIKLSESAPTGFLPVELASGQELVAGDQLFLAGFGQTKATNGTSGRLKQVDTVFNFYNSVALEIVFGPTPGRSACRGDSGGPMYIEREGRLQVIGVTSRGFSALGPCSGNGNYTEVSAHKNWIEESINEMD